MFYYKEMQTITSCLVLAAIFFFTLEPSEWAKTCPRFNKYGTIVVFILSILTTVWLLFHKEHFHWKYDIATGIPVDHYSTYYICLEASVIACAVSALNLIWRFFRKKTKKSQ